MAGAGALPAGAADQTVSKGSFKLQSPAFVDGGKLPVDYTCDGARVSPPLEWKNAPAGTRSYALTMHHTSGPGDTHAYWVVYNLPAQTRSLPRGVTGVGSWGVNTVNGRPEYAPPCSKGPGLKSYTLTLYALSAEPKVHVPGAAAAMATLLEVINGRTLATSTLHVGYERPGGAGRPAEQPPQDARQPRAQGRGGGRAQLSNNASTVYVLQGNTLLAYDAKTLKLRGRTELPAHAVGRATPRPGPR